MNTGQLSIQIKDSTLKIDEETGEEASIEEFTAHTPRMEKAKSGIKVSKLVDHKNNVRKSVLKSSPMNITGKSVTFKQNTKDE